MDDAGPDPDDREVGDHDRGQRCRFRARNDAVTGVTMFLHPFPGEKARRRVRKIAPPAQPSCMGRAPMYGCHLEGADG